MHLQIGYPCLIDVKQNKTERAHFIDLYDKTPEKFMEEYEPEYLGNLKFVLFISLGEDDHGRRRGMDTPLSLRLRHPLHAMTARFKSETSISLLIPAFSLLNRPLLLPVQLRPVKNAPLPLV